MALCVKPVYFSCRLFFIIVLWLLLYLAIFFSLTHDCLEVSRWSFRRPFVIGLDSDEVNRVQRVCMSSARPLTLLALGRWPVTLLSSERCVWLEPCVFCRQLAQWLPPRIGGHRFRGKWPRLPQTGGPTQVCCNFTSGKAWTHTGVVNIND